MNDIMKFVHSRGNIHYVGFWQAAFSWCFYCEHSTAECRATVHFIGELTDSIMASKADRHILQIFAKIDSFKLIQHCLLMKIQLQNTKN